MNKLGLSMGIALGLVGLIALGIYLGVIPSEFRPSELSRIKKSGVLVIATDATYPPLESVGSDGVIVGYDADVANLIAKSLGVKAVFKNTPFDTIFDTLEKTTADVVISSVSVTPERQKIMAFSDPYFTSGQIIVVADGQKNIATPRDLRGKKVGAQTDTTSREQALLYTDASCVVDYADNDTAASDLKTKVIDALIIDYPAGVDVVRRLGGLRVVGGPFTKEYYGIAMRKDNSVLRDAINQIIADAKDTGELQQLQDRWFK